MNSSSQNYQYFANSATKVGKDKCGDSFIIHQLKEENLIVMIVADGISSLPCDWLASKTACETVISVFVEASGSIPGRMKSAASQANYAVRSATSSCQGMMTSISLAVWEIGADKIHYLNVGDSRIYIGTENNLKQITVDDTASVLLKKDGEALLRDGMPVFRRGVTRSLGQADPLVFKVETHEFAAHDLLVIVSDGIFQNEAFTSEINNIFTDSNFSDQLTRLVTQCSEKNKDDATLVIFWRTEKDENTRALYEECVRMQTDFRAKNLGGQIIIEFLQCDLSETISEHANTKINELLNYAQNFNLKFSRAFLSEFLSSVIKQGTDRQLVSRLRDLIRKTS